MFCYCLYDLIKHEGGSYEPKDYSIDTYGYPLSVSICMQRYQIRVRFDIGSDNEQPYHGKEFTGWIDYCL